MQLSATWSRRLRRLLFSITVNAVIMKWGRSIKLRPKRPLFNGQSSISLFSCDRNESRLIAARHVCACKTDLSNCHTAQGHRFDHWLQEQLQRSLIYIHANLCRPRKSPLAIYVAATSQCTLYQVPTKLCGTNAVQGTHKENCYVLSSFCLGIQSLCGAILNLAQQLYC